MARLSPRLPRMINIARRSRQIFHHLHISNRTYWRKCKRFLTVLCLSSLFAIVLTQVCSAPASSQLINLPNQLVNQPTINISQGGNIDIAYVRLDGKKLFQISAPTPPSSDNSRSVSPIERRVKTVEFRMENIVRDGFDPETLAVAPAVLNDQTVIVASDKDWGPRPILTVTAADVEVAIQPDSNAVAQEWSEIIQKALLQAHKQRQPPYLRSLIPYALQRLSAIVIGSLGIAGLQKFRRVRRRTLVRQIEAATTAGQDTNLATDPADQTAPRQNADLVDGAAPAPDQEPSAPATSWWERYLPITRLSLPQRVSLNLLIQPILLAAQVSIWLVGIASILYLVPQTRAFADWLLRLPLSLIAVPMGMVVAKRVADFTILLWLRYVWNRRQETGRSYDRLIPHLKTLYAVLTELTRSLTIVFAIILFFSLLNGLYIGLIILATVGFLGKNVLNDYIQTFFILNEDQYYVGDIIGITDTNGKEIAGTVEKVTLRATQLRNLDGELITISHSNIVEVINRSHEWSRANLAIDVAYGTNLDQAIAVIKQVAQGMQRDPAWYDNILEEPTVLGVDSFGDNSITIRLLIKTQPAKQWDVGREYRHRLKPAFDQVGITIPFPQRSIWFENELNETFKRRSDAVN